MSVAFGAPRSDLAWWVEGDKAGDQWRPAVNSQKRAFVAGETRVVYSGDSEVGMWRKRDGSLEHQTATVTYNGDDGRLSGIITNDKTQRARRFAIAPPSSGPPADDPTIYSKFEVCGTPDTPSNSFHILRTVRVGKTRIHAVSGGVPLFKGDAIVNAANEECLRGGGIDGVITALGGKNLADARRALPTVAPNVRCKTGDAVITFPPRGEKFGKLDAASVVHAVGPDFRDTGSEGYAQLRSAYINAVSVAARGGCRTVAFPLISAGVFRGGQSLDEIVKKGVDAIAAAADGTAVRALSDVFVCAFTDEELASLDRAFTALESRVRDAPRPTVQRERSREPRR